MGNNTTQNTISENYLFAKKGKVAIEISDSSIKPEQKEVFLNFMKSFAGMISAMDDGQFHAEFAKKFAQLNGEFVKEIEHS